MTALYNNVAALRNVAALCRLVDRVENRAAGLPGMATFSGPSGWGKSTAAGYAANRHDCHVVQMKSTWRTKKFLEAVAQELSIRPAKVIGDISDQIAERLARSGRTLLIDEADALVHAGMIEVVRDIYESAQVGVILIGEETLPQDLRRWERVHGRMLDWVQAEPGTAQDLEQLIMVYAPDVAIAPELRRAILAASGPSIRRMCVNISLVVERARTQGRAEMGSKEMGGATLFSGEAPNPRYLSAGPEGRAKAVAPGPRRIA